jgi:hypothetical protein
MNENMITRVNSVLDKYSKSYCRNGVLANLYAWEQNKTPLIELLRKHPNWNEDALAVVFEVTQSREIDRYLVSPLKSSLLDLCIGMEMPGEERLNLSYSLDTAISPYAKLLPDEQIVSNIKQYSGVSCAVGQKTSRVINKICQRYGLDKHPEYNARFAQLADSLSPIKIKRKALLSVHPCDYLEMSNEQNSWSSCHCIRRGEYHAGTLSYMNDAVSMIFYTVDEFVDFDYCKKPKRSRQVFCYGDGILLQSRLYPHTDDEEARSIYRDIVQRTISHCLNIPNLWLLKRNPETVEEHCYTHEDALHYQDYTYSCYKPTISLLKDVHCLEESSICIGHTAYCLDCADPISSNDTLYCDSCSDYSDYISCENCGTRILLDGDDDYYVSDAHYCRDCVSWCESCQEYVRDEMFDVRNLQGREIFVCANCCDEYYSYCEDCGAYYHNDTGLHIADGFHCDDCLENHYAVCENCGVYFPREYAMEIDGNTYCADCAKEAQTQAEEVKVVCLVEA